uniref:Uncharacterized protein n=2 Tax=Pycnococcus provasolii TaxID=41880 RepID=A0A7S2YUT5_9CHLO|mmetsp:Transcript_1043/g.2547  ORF Transcript_1043/g.2547 Transcript_1043/m.2547 type:complete len:158 (+) Transcript_1043:87-560(+)|eukprot:CAMPEP_0119189312 /NCGR_PEP_ID=MMETSP1316-20130426/659_1 /TAXON_ID=41880 /ORGANISM="Pycnococcus provasolii, Strain RCC2336" /LENGTH=157 /DNA_ID=CAMNT_0007183893 /DNA_START=50 /DNA_END=523 /DNA_ORIENTATION=-
MSARVNNLFQLRPRRVSLSSGTHVFRSVRTYASKEVITTDKAPAALGPYSQAIKTNQTLYVSGCLGLIPGTKDMKGPTAPEQAEQALDNMGAVLEAGGASYSSVVKTLVLLDDMDDFAAVNEVYSKYFPENPPARSCFAVKTLPLGAKVEIECIAEV